MNKLQSFALSVLVAPAITLGAGSVLAETEQEYGPQPGSVQSATQDPGYFSSASAQSMQVRSLLDASVKTAAGEEVGSVKDLIIDENGQVMAVVVGTSGFLGLGEKDVAISWDRINQAGSSMEPELNVELTRDELESAPEFDSQQ